MDNNEPKLMRIVMVVTMFMMVHLFFISLVPLGASAPKAWWRILRGGTCLHAEAV
jgi:hypothetical protein